MIDHKRYLLVIIVLLSLSAFSTFYEPKDKRISDNIKNMEISIDGWYFTEDIKLDQQTYESLDPKSLIFRNYQNSKGDTLNLILVYHKNDRWGAHDPIVCYKSQGWKIIEKNDIVKIKVRNHEYAINRLVVKKGNILKLVYYYWFSSNKKITASRNKQMFDMVLNGLIHGFTESGFVEMSMAINPVIEKDISAELNDFTYKFTESLKKVL